MPPGPARVAHVVGFGEPMVSASAERLRAVLDGRPDHHRLLSLTKVGRWNPRLRLGLALRASVRAWVPDVIIAHGDKALTALAVAAAPRSACLVHHRVGTAGATGWLGQLLRSSMTERVAVTAPGTTEPWEQDAPTWQALLDRLMGRPPPLRPAPSLGPASVVRRLPAAVRRLGEVVLLAPGEAWPDVIRLEGAGPLLWDAIDGRRPLAEIAAEAAGRFHVAPHDVAEALGHLSATLVVRGLADLE